MSGRRILVVEDEDNLAQTMLLNLRMEGYETLHARTGTEVLSILREPQQMPDLVLLDVMLPDIDGFELCRQLKDKQPGLPVFFLTARSAKTDKIGGLSLGADDYLTKPFDLDELLLRIANRLKRNDQPVQNEAVMVGDCRFSFTTFEADTVDGTRTILSRREAGLLKLLTGSPGKVISRDEIIAALWDSGENASSRTIDNYILALRKYFERDPKNPRHFHSVRGVGYRFTP